MATSTKNSRKTTPAGTQADRSGLPGSTVGRGNLGPGKAEALNYAAPASQTGQPTAQQPAETFESTGAGLDEIALRAYYLSECRRREGTPGDETSDWLQAENELLGSTRLQ